MLAWGSNKTRTVDRRAADPLHREQWRIAFGNGINKQPNTALILTAGPNDETHGIHAYIDAR